MEGLTDVPSHPYSDPVDYSVLGPLRVESSRGPVEIRGAKERLLLARLVAAGGRMVTASELIDTLWGDEPPASAAKSLQTFVLRLRNVLEPGRHGSPTVLVTEGPGYRLALEPGQVDAERFVRLARIGERALAEGHPENAVVTLTEALDLWRGPAYAGFDGASFAAAEGRRLEELRVGAVEDRIAADLAVGRATSAVPELEALVARYPMRERLWESLVTALYRTGRQGDALGAYERARTVLADELGVDPGPGLREVHARVLAHDPTLGAPRGRQAVPVELRAAHPLVGREEELCRLRQAWSAAVRGPSATIVVRGPEGAGGSALASALAAEVAREGATVLYRSSDSNGGASTGSGSGRGGAVPVLLVADHADVVVPATLTVRLTGHLGAVPEGAEVIELTPLAPHEVRQVVTEHVPAEEATAVTERVLARTGGWPGAVHEAAAAAARELATRKVGAAALVTGAASAELSVARGELADGVEILRDGAGQFGEPPDPRTCPWRGLASYGVQDAPWFAGRDRLVAELVSRLAGGRLLALVGASGSGKSSVLRAGLLAALGSDVLPGSATWRVVSLRPGAHPLRQLARAALGPTGRDEVAELLTQLVAGSGEGEERVVIAVDQFEEVWTVCTGEEERAQFLDTLTELATDPRSNATVVLAVRADFAGQLGEHDGLRALANDGTVFVGPMTAPEVRRAVERPAAAAGLVLDDGLADTIVTDAGDAPGLLPLLSTAMAQLWERREGAALTYAAYVALGGLSGAIATLAEETYASLSAQQQGTTRLLMLRLTGPGVGESVTRRRVPLAEMESLPHPGVRQVVEELAAARLLAVADAHVEVAHEALFREWPRLRGWLVEDAAGRAVQRRLAVAAAEWDADGREGSALWTGTRLASGLEVLTGRPDELTSVERDFLAAGRDAVDAEQRAAQQRATATARQNRRLRWLVAGIAVVLVTALVAGLVAWRSQQDAQAASVSAQAKGLAASALNIEYPDTALLAAVEATKLERSPETYGALLTLLARQPFVAHRVRTPDRFLRIAAAPDGSQVFLGENNPRVSAVDTGTGAVQWDAQLPDDGQASGLAVTPDGEGVLVSVVGDHPWVVRLDARTGKVDWQVDEAALTGGVAGVSGHVDGGGFTADGRYLLASDTHVFGLDPGTGAVGSAVPWPQPLDGGTDVLVVWPDGRVSRDQPQTPEASIVFDPAHPRRGLTRVEGVVLAVAPDGSRALVTRGGENGTNARVVDGITLKDASPAVNLPDDVRAAAFSSDGRTVALSVDRGVRLLDPTTMALRPPMVGHSGAVLELRFAGADGNQVWTAGRDGTSVAFDLSGTRTPVTARDTALDPHIGRSAPAAGRGVYLDLLERDPNTAHVVDLATGADLGQLEHDLSGHLDGWPADAVQQPSTVAVAADGASALVGLEGYRPGYELVDDAGFVVIFDAATRRQRAVVDTPWPVAGIAVAPDGRRAVVNGVGGYAVLDLDAARLAGEPVGLPPMVLNLDWTAGAEVSPDGTRAALARDGKVVVVDVATGALLTQAVVEDADTSVQALAWSKDSAVLAAGTMSGRLYVLSGETLRPVAPSRLITGGWVTDLETSPDGQMLASIGSDGDTTLWDTATWHPYGQPVTDDRVWGWLVFSADSSTLTVFYEQGQAVTLSTAPGAWVAAACAAAGRNLTEEESAVILPSQPVGTTCPDPA